MSKTNDTSKLRREIRNEADELTADELKCVCGGGRGGVVQAGWNLAQNKKAA